MKADKLKELVDYILTWLCYGDNEAAKRVAYTSDLTALDDHDVVVVPNGKLGYSIVLPDMGNVKVEHPAKGKTVIRTDIVYNTFFFVSRAEETFNTERDEYDRFAAKYSILGHKNRMQIPLLDEHARVLMKALDIPLPAPGFGHIYLTHDIDAVTRYRSLRAAVSGLKRGEKKAVWAALRDIHNDPYYTFPWLIEQDKKVKNAESIYFVKQTRGKGYDAPQYCLRGKDFKRLKKVLLENGAKLGVAGYTDDFTMGFADEAGFRLQTTRAVRWINPMTYKVTPLTLHPLMIMDCTLSEEKYMDMNEEEAFFLCERIIEKVKMHHGDLCLLWHNSRLTPDTYHASLYQQLITYLAKQ